MEDDDNNSKLLQILVDQWDDSNYMVGNLDCLNNPIFGNIQFIKYVYSFYVPLIFNWNKLLQSIQCGIFGNVNWDFNT